MSEKKRLDRLYTSERNMILARYVSADGDEMKKACLLSQLRELESFKLMLDRMIPETAAG